MPFDESWSKFDSLMGLPPKLPEQEIDPHPDPWGRFDEIMATPAPEPPVPGPHDRFMSAGADVAKRVPAKFMERVQELPQNIADFAAASELRDPGMIAKTGMPIQPYFEPTEAQQEASSKQLAGGLEAISTVTGPVSVAVGEAAREAGLPPAAALALEVVASLPEGAGVAKLLGKVSKITKGLKVFKRGEKAAEAVAKKVVKAPSQKVSALESFKQLQISAEETAEAVSKKPLGVEALPPVEKGKTRLYRWEGEGARKAGAAGGVEGGAWWETGPGTYYQKGAKGRYLDIPEERFKQLQDKPTSTEIELVGKDIGAAQRISKEIPIEEKVFKQVSRRESIEGGGGLPMPATLPERVGPGKGLKLSRFTDETGMEQAIREEMTSTANVHRSEIQAWRRGKVLSDDRAKGLATELGMSEREVRKLASKNVGSAYNVEEMLAMGDMVKKAHVEVRTIGDKLRGLGAKATLETENEFKGAIFRAVGIQARLHGAVAEAGRALRIVREVGTGNFIDPEIFKGLIGGGSIDDMLRQIKEGAAVGEVIGKAIKKPDFFDKLFEYRIAMMLSNPRTHAVNIGSTAVYKGVRLGERAEAGAVQAIMDVTGVQKLLGKAGFTKTTTLTEAASEMYGGFRALEHVPGLFKDFQNIGKTAFGREKSIYAAWVRKHGGKEVAQKYEADFARAIAGKKGKAVRASLNALVVEDDFSKAYSHLMRAYGLAGKKAAKEARFGSKKWKELADKYIYDKDIFDAAVSEAEELTYVDVNALTKFVTSIRGATFPVGRGYQPFRWIIPFGRVPANLTYRIAERSPFIGYAFQVVDIATKKTSVAEGFAKPLMSTAAASMLVGSMVDSGTLTGSKPLAGSAETAARQIPRAAGWAPTSIRIGDKYFNYKRLEPVGPLVAMVVDSYLAYKEYKEGYGTKQAADTMIRSASQHLGRQSFLGDLGEFIESGILGKTGRTRGEAAGAFTGQFVGSFIPASGAMGEVARRRDPLERETKGFKGTLYRQIPGAKETLKPRKDYFEREVPSKEAIGFATKVPSQSELQGLMKAEKFGNLKRQANQIFKEDTEATQADQKQMMSRLRQALKSAPPTSRRIRLATKSIKEGGPSQEVTRQVIGRKGLWEVLLKAEYKDAWNSGKRQTMNAIKREARRVGLRINWDLVEVP